MRIPGRRFDAFLSWVVDGFVCLLGFWCLLSQAVGLAGGTGRTLARLTPLAVLAGASAMFFLARAGRRRGLPAGDDAPTDSAAAAEAPIRPALAALAGALILALFYALTGLYVPFWIAGSAFLFFFYARVLPAPALRMERSDVGAAGLIVFVLLAAIAVGAVLFIQRPQSDDSLYLSVAVGVHDHPEAPLMSQDTLSGNPGQPFQAPQHRLRTYDVLVGQTARWLGLEPIAAAHLLFPPLFALLFLVAAARFLRLLLGRLWLSGLAALVLLLLANGDVDTSYGNTAFVLLFQGKAILTTVMVPILAVYGLDLMTGPRRPAATAGLIVLALAASVSFSTNGLFIGPIAAGLGMAGGWRPDAARTRRLLIGGAALVYPLALGIFLRGTAVPEFYYRTSAPDWLWQARRGLGLVLGWRPFEIAWLTALLGGWTILVDRARRRWILGLALVFVLLFMNPLLTSFWARHLTSTVTFFRLYWALPLPFLLAALFAGLASAAGRPLKPRLRPVVLAVLLAAFAAAVPARWTLGAANKARLGAPGLKTPPTFFAAARLLASATPAGMSVLAPEPVAEWIPTLAGHPPTVVSRRMYLDQQKARMEPAEYELRLLAFQYVSGSRRPQTREEAEAGLDRAIAAYHIGGVAVMRSNPWLGELDAFLRARGFRRRPSPSAHFLLYFKAAAASSPTDV